MRLRDLPLGICAIGFALLTLIAAGTAHHLDAKLLDFLVVVLAVQDVPLLAAFEDGAFLAFDFLAGGGVDLSFLVEQFLHQAANFEANGIPILEKVHFIHFGKSVRDYMRHLVNFVTIDPHSTALYLRTSSFFTFLNISW